MAIAAGRRTELPLSSQGWDASFHIPFEEWQLLQAMRPNVLITGSVMGTNAAVAALTAGVRPAIAYWEPGQVLVLPSAPTSGTVILREVAALSPMEQRQLLEWLEQTDGSVQVIATSSLSLLPLAEGGAFDLRLYYNLNVIYLESAA
jgi:hypothetical protein